MASKIVFVTNNSNKLKEFKQILGNSFPHGIESKAIDLPEYQGEIDFIGKSKCEYAANIIKGPVIVEDTCLGFTAFSGLPGPYIKWFFDKLGSEGLNRMLLNWEDKSATAVCTVAYSSGVGAEVLLFKGEVEGHIVSPRGSNGFGWDTCFQPKGYNKTFAELDSDIKQAISHRSLAIRGFRDYLMNKGTF